MTTNGTDFHADRAPVHYSIGIRELLIVTWRRKHYFLLCLLLAFGLGVVYYLRADHTYEVSTRLLVEKQELSLSPTERGKPDRDLDFLATQAEILKSPAVVAQAAAQLDWPVKSAEISPATAMISSLTVRPVMGTSVLSVGFQARDAEQAVAGIDAIIASYRKYLSQSERSTHLETLELLTRSEKQVRDDLQQLESSYAELRKNSPLGGKGKGGVDLHMALVEQLGRQLADARSHRIQLENQLQIVDRNRQDAAGIADVSTANTSAYIGYTFAAPTPRKGGAATGAIPPTTQELEALAAEGPRAQDIAVIEEQLMQAQLREKELASRFGHKHPDLRAVREQIASLLEQHRAALDAAPELLRTQLEAAHANERQLADLYQSEVETAKVIDLYLLEETQTVEQINRVRGLHDSIVDQVRQLKLTDEAVADGRSRVKVTLLEQPTVPLTPIWPEPLLLFGICGVVGLMCSVGLITFAECRSPTLPPGRFEPSARTTQLVPAMDHG